MFSLISYTTWDSIQYYSCYVGDIYPATYNTKDEALNAIKEYCLELNKNEEQQRLSDEMLQKNPPEEYTCKEILKNQ